MGELDGQTVVVIGGSAGIGLRATLPIGRVVGPADVAALAVHIMSNMLTGATYDIDGGQQFVSSGRAR